jgi:hypothetical protein
LHLLWVDLLRRPPEQTPQQGLELVLKLLDRAILPPLLFEQLVPQGLEELDVTVARLLLGAKPFDFLSKLCQFICGGGECRDAVRGHALFNVDAARIIRNNL